MHGGFSSMSISQRALRQIKPPAEQSIAPISYPSERLWFAVYTSIARETRVRADLRAKGFETFLPMETSVKLRRGRRVKTMRPVFSRYVFVSFDMNLDCRAIRSTDDVEYILENNQVPVTIPQDIIEELQRIDANGGFDKDKTPKEGEAFRIVDGPFADFIGKVKSASPGHRVKLVLNFVHRSVAAEFALAQLERVK